MQRKIPTSQDFLHNYKFYTGALHSFYTLHKELWLMKPWEAPWWFFLETPSRSCSTGDSNIWNPSHRCLTLHFWDYGAYYDIIFTVRNHHLQSYFWRFCLYLVMSVYPVLFAYATFPFMFMFFHFIHKPGWKHMCT